MALIETEWRAVRDFEGIYEVSNTGHVRRIAPGRRTRPGLILKGYLTNDYPMVKLFDGSTGISGKPRARKHIHRLVADAFFGPCPDGHEVNHKDGVKTNNNVDNLEYVTRLENAQHAKERGLYLSGERVPNSKLTAEQVRSIRALRASGEWTYKRLAKTFGVSNGTISTILSRKWWKDV